MAGVISARQMVLWRTSPLLTPDHADEKPLLRAHAPFGRGQVGAVLVAEAWIEGVDHISRSTAVQPDDPAVLAA
jgi:hypothetical protein